VQQQIEAVKPISKGDRQMMKKLVTAACLTAFVAVGATAFGAFNDARTGVVNSVHNLNSAQEIAAGSAGDAQGRVCAFCHTPHHALPDPTGQEQPLWSHTYTAYVNNWTPYHSPTLDANVTDPLMGPSRLCMSCHDGTVALDTYYGQTGTTFISNGANTYFGAQPLIELDGVKTHPIGFDATAVNTGGAQADSHLWPNYIDNDYRGNDTPLKVSARLFQGTYFTCSSCHDVHNKLNNTANSIPAGTQHYFLLGGQTNSALCITCHFQGEAAFGDIPVTNGSAL
jgi:hypothetical protein